MKKTAFVTGATGFTGGHLARRLLKEGWRVRALVRPSSDHASLKELGCDIVPGDLCLPERYRERLRGAHAVFHIAAYYRDQGSSGLFYRVNVEGTRALLDACIEQGVGRFIHCSTVGVHGEIAEPPADEKAPFAPGDVYQKSKLEAELIVQDYLSSGKIKGSIFRPVGIYGPGDKRFLKLFKMAQSRYTLIIGRGEVLYQMTYIDDLIDGILLLAAKPQAEGEVFILTGPEYTSITGLLCRISRVLGKPLRVIRLPVAPLYGLAFASEKLCGLLGIKPLLYRRRLDFFLKDRAFSSVKAMKLLGYAPQVTLEEGLRRTAEWYKKMNWLR